MIPRDLVNDKMKVRSSTLALLTFVSPISWRGCLEALMIVPGHDDEGGPTSCELGEGDEAGGSMRGSAIAPKRLRAYRDFKRRCCRQSAQHWPLNSVSLLLYCCNSDALPPAKSRSSGVPWCYKVQCTFPRVRKPNRFLLSHSSGLPNNSSGRDMRPLVDVVGTLVQPRQHEGCSGIGTLISRHDHRFSACACPSI